MLIKNPITELVYTYDYNYRGRENIYDYWIKNRVVLLEHLHKHKAKVKNFEQCLEVFELKIRWASFYGMLYRFHLLKYIREERTEINFAEIKIKYGRRYLLHNEFIQLISEFVEPSDLFDLRGLSLIKYTFEDTIIKDVDFSHGALNSCVFKNVTFINCRFNNTEFIGSKLLACHFDAHCTLVDNDFSKSYISGEFDCKVVGPKLTKAKIKHLIRERLRPSSAYLDYSKVESKSFFT